MPKPIADYEGIYVEKLLKKVLEKSRISTSSNASFYQLQHAIYENVGQAISLSTLKRLYSVNTKNTPTQVSLDICSKYVGFDGWKSFLEDVRRFNIYILQHHLSIAIIERKIDFGAISVLCEQYGAYKEIHAFVFSLIRLASEQKNLFFFTNFFSLPKVFSKLYHNEYDFYYLGQAISLGMRSNPEIAEGVKEIYCTHPLALKYCVESFVDEDHLEGYYGVWLREYLRHNSTNQAKAFYYALSYKKARQNAEVRQARNCYRQLKKVALGGKLFKIVEARYCAIMLMEEHHESDIKTSPIFKRIAQVARKSSAEYIDYHFYLLRCLFMSGKHHRWMCSVVNLFDGYPVSTDEHWTMKNQNGLQLYKAYAYHLQAEHRKAQDTFHLVNTQLFDPFMYQSMMQDYITIRALICDSAI